MTRHEALALAKKHGTQAAAAKALGVPRSTFSDWCRGIHCRGETKPATGRLGALPGNPAGTGGGGRPLAEFRKQYDKGYIVPARVKEALRGLGAGWEYEVQFARMAGVSLSDLGNFRDQFADHVVCLHGARRAWAGTPATAKAMREML